MLGGYSTSAIVALHSHSQCQVASVLVEQSILVLQQSWVVCNLANLSINVKKSAFRSPPRLLLTIPDGWFYNL